MATKTFITDGRRVYKLEKATKAKPKGHKAYIRRTKTGKVAQVKEKPYIKQAKSGIGKYVTPKDFKYAIDESTDFDLQEMLSDTEIDAGGRRFKFYSGEGEGLVTSVKGKGFPDPDAIVAGLDKKGYVLTENWKDEEGKMNSDAFDQLFWDDVSAVQDGLSEEFDGFTVAGRMAGYWGVHPQELQDYLEPKVNYAAVYKTMKPEIDAYLKSDEFKEDVGGQYPISPKRATLNFIADNVDKDKILENTTLEPTKKLNQLGKAISGVLKDFEKQDRWIEEFITNGYAAKYAKKDKKERQ